MDLIEELNRIKIANSLMNKDSEVLGIRPFNTGELIQTPLNKQTSPEISTGRKFTLDFKIKAILPGLSIIIMLALGYSLFAIVTHTDSNTKPTRLSEIKARNIPKAARALVISSGDFKNLETAEKYKDRLAKKLGIEMKVLKDHNRYTVQIGPSYSNKEDAIVVFDELSRYSVKDLSLRLDRV